jgi:hypothetical protein
MKKNLLAAVFSLCMGAMLYAQDSSSSSNRVDQFALGVGLGTDYGGIGANAIYYPIENVGVFGGVGYALAGAGYNAGVKLRWVTRRSVDPYFVAMYGYNAAFVVADANQFNKLFYGPTVGLGVDFRSKKPHKTGYWSLAVLVPIRSSEVDQYESYLKNSQGIKFENELIPVGISIGYHFILK